MSSSPPVGLIHSLVGESQQIRQIRQTIDKIGRSISPVLLLGQTGVGIGRSRSPVLILGETGVGKEVVARAIHNVASDGNFVPIDCGSLVGPLMESELFGHVKGAFTGASESKQGLIALANGGTAFFDEIGDLPLDLQTKLLRVFQEREYRPVGSLIRHKADFRILSATHRDLANEVARGNFRQDLFYRLNVINIRIPPLRERPEDILPLTRHFLAGLGKNHSLSAELEDALLAYEWPGNVRELSNCIQRMTALNSGPLLHTADMPSSLQNHLGAPYDAQGFAGSVVPLVELEKRAILQALDHTKGDHSLAAHLLGIGRTTLYRKLQEYRQAAEETPLPSPRPVGSAPYITRPPMRIAGAG